jgi:hypothetical protein
VLGHPVRKGPPDFNQQTKSVARLSGVGPEDAAMVLKTAKMMQDTQTAERIDAYREKLPIRSALDWFLERKRFS